MNTINEILPDVKLRFNIDHPGFEECYAFGYECGLGEINEAENPFASGTQESEQWLEGWWAGFYKEEPAYDITDYMVSHDPVSAIAANDASYPEDTGKKFFTRVLELSSIIAVSAIVGYQVIDMVA